MGSKKYGDRYRILLDALSHGVQENDCTGTITYSNRAHHRILGYADGELIGDKIWSHLHPDLDKEELQKYLSLLVATQPAPTPYITQNIRKDGTSVELQVDWDYVYDQKNELTGFVSLITENSEHKKLEKNLQNLNREYAALLKICRSLAETLDWQRVLQISADSVVELVGLDTAAIYLLEENVLHLKATTPPLPPDFPEEMRVTRLDDHPHVKKALDSREPVYIYDFPEAELTQVERSVAELRNARTLLFVPLLLEENAMGVFIVGSTEKPAVLSDVRIDLSRTLAGLSSLSLKNAKLFEESNSYALKLKQMLDDRIQMMEEKNKLEAQLQQAQKMEAVGALAGGIAHDFNNMLGGIMGAAELLGPYLSADAKARQLHRTILDSAHRAGDLTKHLLTFSRQSAKTSTSVNLHEIIRDTVSLISNTIDKKITVKAELNAKSSYVVGDPSLLQNALLNLCINGSQAMVDGGTLWVKSRQVELDEEFCRRSSFKLQPGKHLEVEVRDSGCGIQREHLDRIFEPFFTTKETGVGTGLGLFSVYGTVQQHGGAITVYSEPDSGSSFQILLPVTEQAENSDADRDDVKKGSGCILVVDDEEIMRSTAKAILETLGYEVILADNGQTALDTYNREQERIDLVLLDMVMPVMNGRDCFLQLLKHAPEVPVILSSGFSTEDDFQEMKRSGLKGFIRKPYLTRELGRIVHEALQSGR